ncbi:MAG: DUF192 domain-containing protein [Halobacteriales archaeon]
MRRRVTVAVVVCLVAVSGCLGVGGDGASNDGNATVDAPQPYTDATVSFVVDGESRGELGVEVADTRRERARGLMERETLPDDTGMLFVYGSAEPQSFWMKDTLVPLDIIFVDEEMRVLNVEHADVPEPGTPDDELSSYTSDGAARYVVEAERSYANRTGVSRGDELVIRR